MLSVVKQFLPSSWHLMAFKYLLKYLKYFFYTFTGLEADGIYRVSGNLATIQKLRFKVDQGNVYILPLGSRT